MAVLTAKQRHGLPSSDFALPGGRYPVNDPAHARNALARGAQHASPAELAKIKAKVHSKFPSIAVKPVSRYKNGGPVQHKFRIAPHHNAVPGPVAPQSQQVPAPMTPVEPPTNIHGIPLHQPMSVQQMRLMRG